MTVRGRLRLRLSATGTAAALRRAHGTPDNKTKDAVAATPKKNSQYSKLVVVEIIKVVQIIVVVPI